MERETRQDQTSNKLGEPWLWLEGNVAADFAQCADKTTEALRKGQGLLDIAEYVRMLRSGEIEIIVFKNQCAALVAWGRGVEGTILTVLTITGTLDQCKIAIDYLEQAARKAHVDLLVGVVQPGWEETLKAKGYETRRKLFARKKLK